MAPIPNNLSILKYLENGYRKIGKSKLSEITVLSKTVKSTGKPCSFETLISLDKNGDVFKRIEIQTNLPSNKYGTMDKNMKIWNRGGLDVTHNRTKFSDGSQSIELTRGFPKGDRLLYCTTPDGKNAYSAYSKFARENNQPHGFIECSARGSTGNSKEVNNLFNYNTTQKLKDLTLDNFFQKLPELKKSFLNIV